MWCECPHSATVEIVQCVVEGEIRYPCELINKHNYKLCEVLERKTSPYSLKGMEELTWKLKGKGRGGSRHKMVPKCLCVWNCTSKGQCQGLDSGGLPASLDLTVLLGFVEVESHMVPQASLEPSL